MTYITIPVTKNYQISFDDILNGLSQDEYEAKVRDTRDTRTTTCTILPESFRKFNIHHMITLLEKFNYGNRWLVNTEDKSVLYHSFKIPKRSGGLRQIDAPKEDLMMALRDLKFLFEKKLYSNYHTSAFAYVKGRSTIDAVRRHQQNNSRWFLKLDFHDFFGSTTLKFVMNMLSMIFPYSEIVKLERGREALETALSVCFLNGGLPQGTPISPTLTNLVMIPIDYAIAKYGREHSPRLVYTRYADDIILSSQLKFDWSEVQNEVMKIAQSFNAPFKLNTKKTRFGSSAGRNWNLGVMLNKDNQITIGHQKKKTAKACVFQFMQDMENNLRWSLDDVQHLQGLLAYYKMVEPEFVDDLLKKYSDKFGKDVTQTIKSALKETS